MANQTADNNDTTSQGASANPDLRQDITREELKRLNTIPAGPAVSIFMPTHIAGKDTRENPIRFKNRLHDAAAQLEAQGFDEEEVDAILREARKLVDNYDFWQHQREGFALFCAADMFLQYKLPIAPEEVTVVGGRFHMKPLMPLLTGDGRFYILAATQNRVRLLEATRHSVSEVPWPQDVPQSLPEALKYDELEQHMRQKTVSPDSTGSTGQGRNDTNFHGTGAKELHDNTLILRFFKQLDNGIRDHFLHDQHVPLVFMGVDFLFPIFQEANHYNGLLEEAVLSNPEGLRDEEIQQRAWEAVEPQFKKSQDRDRERFMQSQGTGSVSNNLREVLPSALDSRIDVLFVALEAKQWGEFDLNERSVTFYDGDRPGAEDLLDFAALHTLLNGGTVYAVHPDEVPGGGKVAAIYRF